MLINSVGGLYPLDASGRLSHCDNKNAPRDIAAPLGSGRKGPKLLPAENLGLACESHRLESLSLSSTISLPR